MPTNFTVVPVKDGTKKVSEGEDEEEDVDDKNAPRGAEGDAAGESFSSRRSPSGNVWSRGVPLFSMTS